MKVYVTLGEKEFAVELDGDRARVEVDGGEIEVRLVPPRVPPHPASPEEVVALPAADAAGALSLPHLRVVPWGPDGGCAADRTLRLLVRGRPVVARLATPRDVLRRKLRAAPQTPRALTVASPLPGVIRHVFLFPGNEVRAGQPIMTLEAMKMENEIRPEVGGVIEALHVEEGQVVSTGEQLCEIRVVEEP